MQGPDPKRTKKVTALFGAVAVLAGAKAAHEALKIAATPIDPLGLPKLPVRLVKMGGAAAIAAAAGLAVASRCDRDKVKLRIRCALRPNKGSGGLDQDM